DRRREANALASLRRATIAGLRLLHFDRADPRLDRANRIMSVANYALAAVRKGQIGVRGKKRIEFDLNRPCNQPTSAGSQNFGERIIDFVFLSERDDAILVHGVTLLLGDSGGLVTNPVTPPSPPRHPVSSIARHVLDRQRMRGLSIVRFRIDVEIERILRRISTPASRRAQEMANGVDIRFVTEHTFAIGNKGA